jgi:hypothetical protein
MQQLEQALTKAQEALEKEQASQAKEPGSTGKQDSARPDGRSGEANSKNQQPQVNRAPQQSQTPQSSSKQGNKAGTNASGDGAGESGFKSEPTPQTASSSSSQGKQSKEQQQSNDPAARNKRGPGSQDSSGSQSPEVDRSATARPGNASDEGPTGPGLGGQEQFKDVAIESANETLDQRYTGGDSSLEKNDVPAQPKTSIEDVTLAKPKPSSQKQDQPIPLEYREVLKGGEAIR